MGERKPRKHRDGFGDPPQMIAPGTCEACVWGERYSHTCNRRPSPFWPCYLQHGPECARCEMLRKMAAEIDAEESKLLPCGHPRSALYKSKYSCPDGECAECGAEYASHWNVL